MLILRNLEKAKGFEECFNKTVLNSCNYSGVIITQKQKFHDCHLNMVVLPETPASQSTIIGENISSSV
jgi:hypothetical protein